MEQVTHDSEKATRRKLAENYLNADLANQLTWYDTRASDHKTYAYRLGLLVIACGALIGLVTALKPSSFDIFDVIVVGLGVVVTISQGILRIWGFDKSWVGYRRAAERMKREQRLYTNACGPYEPVTEAGQRYRLFVERTELIIAEEQELYFDRATTRQEQPTQSGS